MLVLSHPRSGSTEITRIVGQCVCHPEPVLKSMGEFFNLGDRTMFGNVIDALQHFRTSTDPITVKVLVLSRVKIENKRFIEGADYLDAVDITFSSSDELYPWLYNERIKRLDLIKSFDDFYIVKHFITLFDNYTDNEYEIKFTKELVISHFKTGSLIFSYRKNLLESVFSALIKTFYFDKDRIGNKDNEFVHVMADGHNLYDMPVLKPNPIMIPNAMESIGSHFEIDGIIHTNLMLLEFYHAFIDKLPLVNVICYEEIMETGQIAFSYQGKSQVYNIDELPPRISYLHLNNGTVKQLIEKKMNYGDYFREDYFTNSYIVGKIINKEVDKIENRNPGFKQTLSKLGIIY